MKRAAAALLAALLLFSPARAQVHRDRETVMAVQSALNAAGFACGAADGIAGRNTAAAILAYQLSRGLPRTGLVNDRLLVSLGLAEDPLAQCAFVSFPAQQTGSLPCSLTGWYESAASRAALTVLLSGDLAQSGGAPLPDAGRPSFVGVSGNRLLVGGWDAEGGQLLLIRYVPGDADAGYACIRPDGGEEAALEALMRACCDDCRPNEEAFLSAARETVASFGQAGAGRGELAFALGVRSSRPSPGPAEFLPVTFSFEAEQASRQHLTAGEWFETGALRARLAAALQADQAAAAPDAARQLSPDRPVFAARQGSAAVLGGWTAGGDSLVLIVYWPATGTARCGVTYAPGMGVQAMREALSALCDECHAVDAR